MIEQHKSLCDAQHITSLKLSESPQQEGTLRLSNLLTQSIYCLAYEHLNSRESWKIGISSCNIKSSILHVLVEQKSHQQNLGEQKFIHDDIDKNEIMISTRMRFQSHI